MRHQVIGGMRKTTDTDQTIELSEERAHVDMREIEVGRVRIETRTETNQHVVEAVLRQDDVQVERVKIGLIVDVVPEIREVDGVLIIPVIEEQLFVQTRLVLKEELRVTKIAAEQIVRRTVPLRSETASVTRVPGPSSSSNAEPAAKGNKR